jgi:predicted transposase/invertase (TIGR01784 family)
MKKEFNYTHDAFFKSMLANRHYRNGLLAQFLPKGIKEIINLNTLKKVNTTFINEDLKSFYADYIFEASLKGNKKGIVCLLAEHKSQPQTYTSFQILYYIAAAYHNQIFKDKEKPKLIIPIVYYQGKRKWEFKSLDDLFDDLPEVLRPYIPSFKTVFIDLHNYTDSEIESWKNKSLSVATYIQKHAFDKETLSRNLDKLCQKIDDLDDRNLISSIFVYLIGQSETKENKIIEIVEDLNNKKLIMSTLQLIEQRGIKQGKQEGIKLGEQIGYSKSKEQIILNCFGKGYEIKDIAEVVDLSVQKVKSILKKFNKL